MSDPGCDGLDRFVLHVLVERAGLAHQSLLPPVSADLVAWRLRRMRAAVASGGYADDRPPVDTR